MMNDELKTAAQLLGYPDPDCIGTPAELERAGRIATALINADAEGYKRGYLEAAKRGLTIVNKVFGQKANG